MPTATQPSVFDPPRSEHPARILSSQTPLYETTRGAAFVGDSLELMREIEDETVDLVVTSPPYALHFEKEYGNVAKDDYIEWFLPFSEQIRRILKPEGSFVLDISDSSALQLIEALLRDRRTITADLLRQILEFRRHITLHMVELAARNRTPELIDRARALLAQEAEAGSDPEVALEIDVQMNTLLGEATGNLMYQFLSNLFTKLIRRLGPLYYNDRRDHSRSLETHHQLLAALEAGDVAEAKRILQVMLTYSESAILAELEPLEAEGLIGPDAREETS